MEELHRDSAGLAIDTDTPDYFAVARAHEMVEHFYGGLKELAEGQVRSDNFQSRLLKLASKAEFKEQFRGLLTFYETCSRFGLDQALEEVETRCGVPIGILNYTDKEPYATPALLIGLVGPIDGPPWGYLYGIAAVDETGASEKTFVKIKIDPLVPSLEGLAIRLETAPSLA